MLRIAIIADDLTGANDTGVQFCHHGLSTSVIINPASINDFNIHPGKVLSINTNSRSMKGDEAYKTIYRIGSTLKSKKVTHLYKKIDSTLRGNPGVELDALMDVWQAPLGLVVPAFPANGRSVYNGSLYLVADERQGASLNTGPQCYVPDILKQQMKRNVGSIHIDIVRQGSGQLTEALQQAQNDYDVLVIDAVTEKDLETIALAIKSLTNLIVAGSAGLASYIDIAWDIKRNEDKLKHTSKPFSRQGVILFIAGSRNGVTEQQISELAKYTNCNPVVLNPEALQDPQTKEREIERIIKLILHDLYYSNTIIISVGNRIIDSNGTMKIGTMIGETLGMIVSRLLLILNVKGLVVAGGDTALNICNALEAAGINLAAELLDGIPFGYLCGKKHEGLPIVTKAGGFGAPDAFVRIHEMFDELNYQVKGV